MNLGVGERNKMPRCQTCFRKGWQLAILPPFHCRPLPHLCSADTWQLGGPRVREQMVPLPSPKSTWGHRSLWATRLLGLAEGMTKSSKWNSCLVPSFTVYFFFLLGCVFLFLPTCIDFAFQSVGNPNPPCPTLSSTVRSDLSKVSASRQNKIATWEKETRGLIQFSRASTQSMLHEFEKSVQILLGFSKESGISTNLDIYRANSTGGRIHGRIKDIASCTVFPLVCHSFLMKDGDFFNLQNLFLKVLYERKA